MNLPNASWSLESCDAKERPESPREESWETGEWVEEAWRPSAGEAGLEAVPGGVDQGARGCLDPSHNPEEKSVFQSAS